MSLSIEERAHDIAMILTDRRFDNKAVTTELYTNYYLQNYTVALSMLKPVKPN